MFNTTTNSIQSRVTKMYSAALQTEKASLATHYGAIVGLQELGLEVYIFIFSLCTDNKTIG